MGKFTNKYSRNKISDWKHNYVNYQSLSEFIKQQSSKNQPNLDPSERVKLIESFIANVDQEFKTAFGFIYNKERNLYNKINTCLVSKEKYYSLNESEIENEFNQLIYLSEQTQSLATFICDNIEAIKKILLKFDKHFQKLETHVYNDYIVAKCAFKNSDLLKLLNFTAIDELSTLLIELGNDLLDSFKALKNNPQNLLGEKDNKSSPNNEKQSPLIEENTEDVNVQKGGRTKKISLASIEIKYYTITSSVEEIEKLFQNLQKLQRTWIRMYKLNEYKILSQGKQLDSPIRIDDDMIISGTNLLSKANQWNLFLTVIQRGYVVACSSFIIPNLCNALKDDLREIDKVAYYSGLIISFTSIGGILSIILTKAFIRQSYKIPMILSCLFAILGNGLYSLSFGIEWKAFTPTLRIISFCISRIFIGMALNNRMQRRYIIEYVPKSRTSNFMLMFKFLSLLGNALGPFITLIFSFFNYDNEKVYRLNSYNIPSWFFTIGAIVLLIFVLIFFHEPINTEFNIIDGSTSASVKVLPSDSFKLDLSNYQEESEENKEDNDIDPNKLELVQNSIQKILLKEKLPGNTISKALTLVFLNVGVSNVIIHSLLVFSPIFINLLNEKEEKLPTLEVDRDTSYLIGITLTSFIVLYFINYFYISVKIDKRLYILILSMMLLIVEVLLLRQIEDIETFTMLFVFLIILSYLFEDTTIYFYTKMVPANYLIFKVSPTTILHCVQYFGAFIGSISSLFGIIENDVDGFLTFHFLTYVQIALICITFVFLVICYNHFKEGPIRRIFRNKNKRKLRRTEF